MFRAHNNYFCDGMDYEECQSHIEHTSKFIVKLRQVHFRMAEKNIAFDAKEFGKIIRRECGKYGVTFPWQKEKKDRPNGRRQKTGRYMTRLLI